VAPRDEILAQLVLDSVLWFELVDDETLNPDTAIGMNEAYLAGLQTLSEQDRQWLAARARERAGEEHGAHARETLEQLAEALLDA
jgi:hypothetical protein